MEYTFLWYCLFGGVVSLDTEACGQFNISQPLVACTMAGLILGNVATGMIVGVLLQLPFSVETPVGGSKISMVNLSAYVAAGLAISAKGLFPDLGHASLVAALTFGVLLSWAAVPLQYGLHQSNLLLLKKADVAAAQGKSGHIALLNYLGAVNAFLFGVLFVVVFWWIGRWGSFFILENLTPVFDRALQFIKPVMLGAGAGMLLWHFARKSRVHFPVIGFLLSGGILFIKYIW
ncbi:MAG: PTS sugar transporter subunit IIC [bacterium]